MTREEGPLVGIVVVSHSPALAHAAVELAEQMLPEGPIRVAVAAGMQDDALGTDAAHIKAAIEKVDSAAGVVVLMDLGSAVLSAELALDLLPDPDVRARVVLSPAPLVEGLVVAAVAAAGGLGREEVASQAHSALVAKADHLNRTPPATTSSTTPPADRPAQAVARFVVRNRHGLHMRPAARIVSEVQALDATVSLRNLTTGAGPVAAASLSRVAALGAVPGHQVEVRASGRDAAEAIERLLRAAEDGFGESADPREAESLGPAGPRPASPGIATGPVRRLTEAPTSVEDDPSGDPSARWSRVVEAIAKVRRELERLGALAARDMGGDEARIFKAHLVLLNDAELLSDVQKQVEDGAGAVAACVAALAVVEARWAELPDPYLRARAADVRALAAQLVTALTGAPTATMTGPGILVTAELTAAQAMRLDPELTRGIVLAYGSPTAHAAILARSRGIPALVGAGATVLGLAEGTTIAMDGGSGELVVDPPAATLATFRARAADRVRRQQQHQLAAGHPALTLDGIRVMVAANVGSPRDAHEAAEAGADGVGLVRTEMLFLDRTRAPDVAEQTAEYLMIANRVPGRRIAFRTLDVGGDKPLPYLGTSFGEGRRGIRLALEHRDLLLDQLRAVCAVARQAPTSVLFPMVTTVAELRGARDVLNDAAGAEGGAEGLRVGMMVEVPAAALKIEAFLPYLDFISIGTNDLTQYTVAAQRGDPTSAAFADALDPGVLHLVDHVCRTVGDRMPVAVCGEAAADHVALPVLLGLGIRELSVSPRSVPAAKACVRTMDVARCTSLAQAALAVGDGAEVRRLVRSWFADVVPA